MCSLALADDDTGSTGLIAKSSKVPPNGAKADKRHTQQNHDDDKHTNNGNGEKFKGSSTIAAVNEKPHLQRHKSHWRALKFRKFMAPKSLTILRSAMNSVSIEADIFCAPSTSVNCTTANGTSNCDCSEVSLKKKGPLKLTVELSDGLSKFFTPTDKRKPPKRRKVSGDEDGCKGDTEKVEGHSGDDVKKVIHHDSYMTKAHSHEVVKPTRVKVRANANTIATEQQKDIRNSKQSGGEHDVEQKKDFKEDDSVLVKPAVPPADFGGNHNDRYESAESSLERIDEDQDENNDDQETSVSSATDSGSATGGDIDAGEPCGEIKAETNETFKVKAKRAKTSDKSSSSSSSSTAQRQVAEQMVIVNNHNHKAWECRRISPKKARDPEIPASTKGSSSNNKYKKRASENSSGKKSLGKRMGNEKKTKHAKMVEPAEYADNGVSSGDELRKGNNNNKKKVQSKASAARLQKGNLIL